MTLNAQDVIFLWFWPLGRGGEGEGGGGTTGTTGSNTKPTDQTRDECVGGGRIIQGKRERAASIMRKVRGPIMDQVIRRNYRQMLPENR
jgi:hypothetical protein